MNNCPVFTKESLETAWFKNPVTCTESSSAKKMQKFEKSIFGGCNEWFVVIGFGQEPITCSMQLPHVPVTAFS